MSHVQERPFLDPQSIWARTATLVVGLVVSVCATAYGQTPLLPSAGMNTHYLDTNMVNKMAELGAGFARVDMFWATIAACGPPSTCDPNTQYAWDSRNDFDAASQAGIQIMAT